MKRSILTLIAAVTMSCGAFTDASAVTWVDWQSTNSGTLTVGASTVNVSLAGSPIGLSNGDFYYNNGATGGISPSGTYGGLQPSDMIQVNGSSSFVLNFDSPVVDPYIALVSVGQPYLGVTYNFSAPFSVQSSGGNYWGYGGYSVTGNSFTGNEYNGVLKFNGTFNSLAFNTTPNEYWHGFNLGVDNIASVPAPSTLLLLGSGLGGFALIRRFRKG